MAKSSLKDVFDKRVQCLNDHDPWRYGEKLSLKTDMIELSWIVKHLQKGNLLDMGCGTGRHCIELSKKFPHIKINAFDFAPNNIRIFNQKIKEENTNLNIQTKVCHVEDIINVYKDKNFNNMLSIGLIQYLNNKELKKYFKDCYSLLDFGGIMMIKHPTSFLKTFIFEGYSELLKSKYKSRYRNFQDISEVVYPYFEIEKVERVFNSKNLNQKELNNVEQNKKTKQFWFLLRKKIK
ncbi:MAG: class I SAM-dependent methyltransferase [Patescibacteria group bacterium]